MISSIPENAYEFWFLIPKYWRLISVWNLEMLSLGMVLGQNKAWVLWSLNNTLLRDILRLWNLGSNVPRTICLSQNCSYVFLGWLSEITGVWIQDPFFKIYYVYECVAVGCRWKISELSSKFCCESKIILKSKVFKNTQTLPQAWDIVYTHTKCTHTHMHTYKETKIIKISLVYWKSSFPIHPSHSPNDRWRVPFFTHKHESNSLSMPLNFRGRRHSSATPFWGSQRLSCHKSNTGRINGVEE